MLGVWIDPVTAQVMIALLRFMGALHSSDENQFLPGILAGIETAERVGSGLDAVVDILVIDKAAVPDQGLEPGDRSRKRSEEHTSELQSLMRISYAVFCLKKKNNNKYKSRYTITSK